MTQKTATSVKSLAPDCFNAIKAIAGERECPKCKGVSGYAGKWECPSCNGTGKVEYVWEPEVNQTVLYGDGKEPMFIVSVSETRLTLLPFDIPYSAPSLNDFIYAPKIIDVIPILPWETIEEILGKLGHWFDFDQLGSGYNPFYRVTICNSSHKSLVESEAKSRQEAVMLAVIALGKEIGNVR